LQRDEASNTFLARIQSLSPKRLALLAVELERRLAARERATAEPIAVLGMACRMPGDAETPEEFWKVLMSGRDAIEPVPPERWSAASYVDPRPDMPGKTLTCGTSSSSMHRSSEYRPENPPAWIHSSACCWR
jgi:hypothetical protein